MFEDVFRRLLEAHSTPAAVRAAEAANGAVPPVWQELVQSGFIDILRPEAEGGAGLSLPAFAPLVIACGEYLLPVDWAETAVARLWHGEAVALDRPAGLEGPDALAANAALTAARMAGACRRVLDITMAHVTTRQQFGRPLSAFQALQQQLAVMAEDVAAARMAAFIGLAGPGFDPARSAVAKLRAGEAAHRVAAMAHQMHGAIGATLEYDLQLWVRALKGWQLAHGSDSYWAMVLGKARLDWAAKGREDATTADFLRERLEPGVQDAAASN